jgi:hypothetical protein
MNLGAEINGWKLQSMWTSAEEKEIYEENL